MNHFLRNSCYMLTHVAYTQAGKGHVSKTYEFPWCLADQARALYHVRQAERF